MIRVLAILIALLVSPSAFAVVCADGVTRADTTANCPAYQYLISIDTVGQTSVRMNGTNDDQGVGATRYDYTSASAYPPGCTASNYTHADLSSANAATALAARQAKAACTRFDLIIAGTGASAHGSETLVYAGTFARTISSLSAGTTYYNHSLIVRNGTCNPYPDHTTCTTTNRGRLSLVETVAFTTSTASGEAVATGGQERYIDSVTGSNLDDGLSDANAWASCTNVTGSLPAGTDINIKTGTTLTCKLSLSHAGASGDPVDVTGYKRTAGVDYILEAGDTLPIIDGGLDTTCLTNGTCLYTPAAYASDVTGSEYGAMIEIAATADYTTLRWLAVQQSRGRCISASGTGSAGSLVYVRLEHMTVTDCGFEGLVFESGLRNTVVRDVDFLRINTCEAQRHQTGTTNTTQCNSSGWAADIQNTRNTSQYALFHNVEVVGGYGESFNFWDNNTSYSIISNVRSSNGLSRCITADTTSDIVIEGAICMGQPDSPSIGWYGGSAGRWGNNIIASYEDFMLPDSTEPSILVRNSMMIRTGIGIQCYIESAAITAGRRCSIRGYGNLIIGSESNAVWTDSGSDLFDLQNNVFWEEALSAADICGMSGTLTGLSMVDNHWYTNPTDSDCDGSGDTYGAPGLAATKTYSQWRTWTAGTFPAFVADATPQAGSALLNSGTDLSTGTDALVSTNYGAAFTELASITGITSALWQERNAYSATYSTRDGTPNKGPVE